MISRENPEKLPLCVQKSLSKGCCDENAAGIKITLAYSEFNWRGTVLLSVFPEAFSTLLKNNVYGLTIHELNWKHWKSNLCATQPEQ